jgi:hypothetical protein
VAKEQSESTILEMQQFTAQVAARQAERRGSN